MSDLCRVAGCNHPAAARGYCNKHQYVQPMNIKDRETQPLTKNEKLWKQAQAEYLAQHDLCVLCDKRRLIMVADVVGHMVQPKGNPVLFWDMTNWQPLCKPCAARNPEDHKVPDPISPESRFYGVTYL